MIFIFPLVLAQQTIAQSFNQCNLVISADLGLTYNSIAQRYIDQYLNLSTNQKNNNGSANYNASAEFGVFNWLGIGAIVQSESYFTQQNSTTSSTPTISSYEGAAVLNIHLIRKEHIDWRFGGTYGFSHLTYDVNNSVNAQVYGKGSWADVHISTRLYLGRFGFNYMLYMPFVNYNNLSANNNNLVNQYITTSWKAIGVGIDVGIQYRFF